MDQPGGRAIELTKITYIIAKHVLHELEHAKRYDLIKDYRFFLNGGALKLLLDEARAVLIAAELDDEPEYILEYNISSASEVDRSYNEPLYPEFPFSGLVTTELL